MKIFKYWIPSLSVLVAVGVTTTMDLTGKTMLSALPLLPIALIFLFVCRLSRKELGLTPGKLSYYGLGIFHLFAVLGITLSCAFLSGNAIAEGINWSKLIFHIGLSASTGVLAILLTEEGFFRGWLWAIYRRYNFTSRETLVITSVFFMIWHISAVTTGTEYGLPWHQVPVYLINVILLGIIWGLMRQLSGTVIVPSFAHAIWNAFAYELFGFGQQGGALQITNSIILGPEVGYLGILLNGLFAFWLWNKAIKVFEKD